MSTTTSAGPFEAVYASLPTVAEGWATPKAVVEVTAIGYSTVTRHLRALEEAGMAECSTDQAVTGVRGKVWRQKPARPVRVLGAIETVELPAADVEPDAEPTVTDADRDAAIRAIALALDAGVIDAPPAADVEPDPCPKGDPDCLTGDAELSSHDACVPPDVEPISMLADDGEGDGPIPGCDCEECEEIAEAAPKAETAEPNPDEDEARDRALIEDDDEDGDPSPVSPAPTGGDVGAIADWMAGQRAADPLSAQDARALTDRIRLQVTELLPLIKEAYSRRADLALGYGSWSAYCDAELRGLRMPLAERQTATAALAAEGMSTRAIAGAIGSSEATVRRDLSAAGAPDDAPERVTGLDGRSYPARKPAMPKLDPAAVVAASQPKPTEEPDPLRVRAHAWQILHPNDRVWIATSRIGIEYHRPADLLMVTGCDRSMRTGERISIADVENELSATPCPRCWGPDVAWAEPAEADAATEPAAPLEVDADAPTPVSPSTSDATDSQAGNVAAVGSTPATLEQPGLAPQPALVGEVLPPPDRQPLDLEYRNAVAAAILAISTAVSELQDLVRDGEPAGSLTVPDLKHERRRLDRLIVRLQKATA